MSNIIVKAAQFAASAHHGQQRADGEPYINHPMRVAGMITMREKADEEVIAAAWLHDTIEDCNVSYDEIFDTFGKCIADMVVGLTNVYTYNNYPDMSRADRKAAEAKRLRNSCGVDVQTIKMADRYDNINNILGSTRSENWMCKYISESKDLVYALHLVDIDLRTLTMDRIRVIEGMCLK